MKLHSIYTVSSWLSDSTDATANWRQICYSIGLLSLLRTAGYINRNFYDTSSCNSVLWWDNKIISSCVAKTAVLELYIHAVLVGLPTAGGYINTARRHCGSFSDLGAGYINIPTQLTGII